MKRDQTKVLLGCENFLEKNLHLVKNKKVGLITNPSGVDRRLRNLIDVFFEHAEIDLVALYAPEHGIRGNFQAGQFIPFYTDKKTGLPVFSLYSQFTETGPALSKDLDELMRSFDTTEQGKHPQTSMLEELEVLIYDIQDVGTRIYSYIATMSYCMQACADRGVRFVVLDRPNPINGKQVEGPVLDYPDFSSFVGMYPIPVRHGLTAGELALLFNDRFLPKKADLKVIPMEGWKRGMWYDQTGLLWVSPSPNMPTLQTAMVYPGQVFLEGTNISEGRGTTKPFELFGAPWIDGHTLVGRLNELELPGIIFREAWFTPMFSKYEGQICSGAQLHIENREAFKPFETGLHILKTVKKSFHREFRFHSDYFDRIMGTDTIRQALEEEIEIEAIVNGYSYALEGFSGLIKAYLLY